MIVFRPYEVQRSYKFGSTYVTLKKKQMFPERYSKNTGQVRRWAYSDNSFTIYGPKSAKKRVIFKGRWNLWYLYISKLFLKIGDLCCKWKVLTVPFREKNYFANRLSGSGAWVRWVHRVGQSQATRPDSDGWWFYVNTKLFLTDFREFFLFLL